MENEGKGRQHNPMNSITFLPFGKFLKCISKCLLLTMQSANKDHKLSISANITRDNSQRSSDSVRPCYKMPESFDVIHVCDVISGPIDTDDTSARSLQPLTNMTDKCNFRTFLERPTIIGIHEMIQNRLPNRVTRGIPQRHPAKCKIGDVVTSLSEERSMSDSIKFH